MDFLVFLPISLSKSNIFSDIILTSSTISI